MIYIPRMMVAIILYTFIVLLLMAFKPSLMFDIAGRAKQLGVGMADTDMSVFAPAFAFPLIAVMSYLVTSISVFAVVIHL